MFSTIFAAIAIFLLLPISASALRFWNNYRFARASGLPFIVSLINPLSPFWLGLQATRFVRVRQLFQLLPGAIGHDAEFLFPGWQLHDKARIHDRLGKNFLQVTPGRLLLHVGDASTACGVLDKWKDFQKLKELYGQVFTLYTMTVLITFRCHGHLW